jgi:hypothetical protein
MGLPTVGSLKLTLQAARIDLPLQALRERLPGTGPGLRPPRIGPPRVSDEFELKPIREIALRELLSHAASGMARVHLPLEPSSIRKGPFTIDIPEGTEAVIDFQVEEGRILRDRSRTRGRFVPDISLPLGLKFRGIYLDEDGSIIADISPFPNLNLSWLNVANLRVPETLDSMLAMLFGTASPPDGERPGGGERAALAVRLDALRVQASQVVPRPETLSLGAAGALDLGPDTRLDVDYARDGIEIGGEVDVARAFFVGTGFAVRGLKTAGTGRAVIRRVGDTREIRLDLHCREASMEGATISLLDGSRLELQHAAAQDVEVTITTRGGEAHFQLATTRLQARVSGGVLMVWIGGQVRPVEIAEMDVSGTVVLGDERGLYVDVEVRGALMKLGALDLPFGIADLSLAGMEISGSGRLKAGRDTGYLFSGSMGINADLSDGVFDAGPVRAHLLEGTHINLAIRRAGGRERLHELDASGTVELKLASGSLPVGRSSRLNFSRGGTGTLAIHSLVLESGSTWPRVEAGARLHAETEAGQLDELVELPAGLVGVEIPQIRLAQDGNLSLHELIAVLDTAVPDSES